MVKLARTIKKIKPSVVKIHIDYMVGGKHETEGMGTGFIVNTDGLIVTAKHVVDAFRGRVEQLKAGFDVNDEAPVRIRVGLPMNEVRTAEMWAAANFRNVSADIVLEDIENDLALLKIDPEQLDKLSQPFSIQGITTAEGYPEPFVLNDGFLEDGEYVAISGYPLAEPSMVTTSGNIASTFTPYGTTDRILGDITANPGNSGGPVYRVEDGKVIGVLVAGRMKPQYEQKLDLLIQHATGLSIIVPARYVTELIKKYNDGNR